MQPEVAKALRSRLHRRGWRPDNRRPRARRPASHRLGDGRGGLRGLGDCCFRSLDRAERVPGGAQAVGPDTRVNAAAPRVATPPKAMADAAPAPPRQAKREQNREATANKPAPDPGHEVAPGEPSSQTHPPRGQHPGGKSAARGFPPVPRSPRQTGAANSFAPDTKRRRYALTGLSRAGAGLRRATGSKRLGRRHLVPPPARLLRLVNVSAACLPEIVVGARSEAMKIVNEINERLNLHVRLRPLAVTNAAFSAACWAYPVWVRRALGEKLLALASIGCGTHSDTRKITYRTGPSQYFSTALRISGT